MFGNVLVIFTQVVFIYDIIFIMQNGYDEIFKIDLGLILLMSHPYKSRRCTLLSLIRVMPV